MNPNAQHRSVGRPRQFDEAAALEAAMAAFWNKGYEATSMAELCNCTGLHKGSLYQAFGGKHELFMSALKHYGEQQFREVATVVSSEASPLENIRVVVDKLCTHSGQPDGCLMINSVVELAPHDDEVKELLQGFARKRLGFMAEMIAAAQEAGEISVKQAPDQLARQLMLTVAGGAVLVKGLIEFDDIRNTIENLIDSWV